MKNTCQPIEKKRENLGAAAIGVLVAMGALFWTAKDVGVAEPRIATSEKSTQHYERPKIQFRVPTVYLVLVEALVERPNLLAAASLVVPKNYPRLVGSRCVEF